MNRISSGTWVSHLFISLILVSATTRAVAVPRIKRDPELSATACRAYLDQLPSRDSEIRAKADRIVSWIAGTHPAQAEALQRAIYVESVIGLLYLPLGYVIGPPPDLIGKAHPLFAESTQSRQSVFRPSSWGKSASAISFSNAARVLTESGWSDPTTLDDRLELVSLIISNAGALLSEFGRDRAQKDLNRWVNPWFNIQVILTGNPPAADQAIRFRWPTSFTKPELAELRTMTIDLSSPQVRAIVVQRISAHLPQILEHQARKLMAITGHATLSAAQDALKTIGPLALWDDPSSFTSSPPITSDQKTVLVEPMDLANLADFLNQSIEPAGTNDRPPLADQWAQLRRAGGLINQVLLQLHDARTTDFDGQVWAKRLRGGNPAVSALNAALDQAEHGSIQYLAHLESSEVSVTSLGDWIGRYRELMSALTADSAAINALRPFERDILSAILALIPAQKILIDSALDSIGLAKSTILAQAENLSMVRLLLGRMLTEHLVTNASTENPPKPAARDLLIEALEAMAPTGPK